MRRICTNHANHQYQCSAQTLTHAHTYTCILNTCFVLVAVFVIIIAVAGHSRHHGCYALYFCCCCCCCTSTRCVVVVRYISAGTFRFRFSLLLPRLVRSMYMCMYVCVSLSLCILLFSTSFFVFIKFSYN